MPFSFAGNLSLLNWEKKDIFTPEDHHHHVKFQKAHEKINRIFVNENHLLGEFSHMPDCFLVGIKSKCSERKIKITWLSQLDLFEIIFFARFHYFVCM